MPEQTPVQLRISYALKCVNTLKEKDKEEFTEYASNVKALPAAILMNGLGQAAATLKTQKHDLLYHHLGEWLCGASPLSPYTDYSDLLTAITKNDQNHYLHAQHEALQMLQWLKKFADAFAPPKTPKKGAANGNATV